MGKDEFLCIDDIFAYRRCKEQCNECKKVESEQDRETSNKED